MNPPFLGLAAKNRRAISARLLSTYRIFFARKKKEQSHFTSETPNGVLYGLWYLFTPGVAGSYSPYWPLANTGFPLAIYGEGARGRGQEAGMSIDIPADARVVFDAGAVFRR